MLARGVCLIWLSTSSYDPPPDYRYDAEVTWAVKNWFLFPLSITFTLLAVLDLVGLKVDLKSIGGVKRIVYNITGILNWAAIIAYNIIAFNIIAYNIIAYNIIAYNIIAYNITGLLNWAAILLCMMLLGAFVTAGVLASAMPLVPLYYYFRGYKLTACCRLHPNNTSLAEGRMEFQRIMEQLRVERIQGATASQGSGSGNKTQVDTHSESPIQREVKPGNPFESQEPFRITASGNPFESQASGNPFDSQVSGNPFESEPQEEPFGSYPSRIPFESGEFVREHSKNPLQSEPAGSPFQTEPSTSKISEGAVEPRSLSPKEPSFQRESDEQLPIFNKIQKYQYVAEK